MSGMYFRVDSSIWRGPVEGNMNVWIAEGSSFHSPRSAAVFNPDRPTQAFWQLSRQELEVDRRRIDERYADPNFKSKRGRSTEAKRGGTSSLDKSGTGISV